MQALDSAVQACSNWLSTDANKTHLGNRPARNPTGHYPTTFYAAVVRTENESPKMLPLEELVLKCRQLQEQGKLAEAGLCLREIEKSAHQTCEVQYQLSRLYDQMGDRLQSRRYLDLVVANPPDDHVLLNEIGITCIQFDCFDQAIKCFGRAIEIAPGYASAHNNLGNAFKLSGRLREALSSYEMAIRYQPASADFEMNLGRLIQEQGDLAEAGKHFRNAAELDPKRSDIHAALATLFLARGDNPAAFRSAVKALELAKDDLPLRVNMANILQELGRHTESENAYRQILEMDTRHSSAHSNLAYLLADQGRNEEARLHYDAAIQGDSSARLKIVAASKLPPLLMSVEEIQECRDRLSQQLQRLYDDGVRVDTEREMMPTLFYLAYHGKNDRPLLEQLRKLSGAKHVDHQKSAPRSGRRIRVGFLSMNLKQHTIGGLWSGLIEGLSRNDFEVRVLAASPAEDLVTRRIKSRADSYTVLPRDVASALRIVREQDLDLLLYPDIGMDPFTYTLASSRIAPVQCVTWGHPTTSGLETVDYFLSSEHLETTASDEFYTERLVRFRRLMVCYDRPTLPARFRGRTQFGLPESANIYGCPQSLFKFHPDFDRVIGAILESDPAGILVLLEGRYEYWKKLLLQRFQRNLGRLCDRIHFVPRLSRSDYLNLLSITDVLLDPIHFGGGNTSYEGFAMGIPIVTLPSEFLRARLTYAMYQQMELDECIASDEKHYVSLAVKIATDDDYRKIARQRILAANGELFDDHSIIREFEDFVRAAVLANSVSPDQRIVWRSPISNSRPIPEVRFGQTSAGGIR